MHGCSGGMHGCSWWVCMVARGHAWLLLVGCAWDTTTYGDTINERAVCILLECILVAKYNFPIREMALFYEPNSIVNCVRVDN